MSQQARRRYIELIIKRFSETTLSPYHDKSRNLTEHLRDQISSLINWIEGLGDSFQAWRIR